MSRHITCGISNSKRDCISTPINQKQKSNAKLCQKFDVCAINKQVLSSCSRPSAALFDATATKYLLASSVAQHRQICCVSAEDSTSPPYTSKGALLKARSNLVLWTQGLLAVDMQEACF